MTTNESGSPKAHEDILSRMLHDPPAFPYSTEFGDGAEYTTPGMSLRDWFAGQALAGIVCGTQAEKMKPSGPGECAHWAYSIADAMLAERSRIDS